MNAFGASAPFAALQQKFGFTAITPCRRGGGRCRRGGAAGQPKTGLFPIGPVRTKAALSWIRELQPAHQHRKLQCTTKSGGELSFGGLRRVRGVRISWRKGVHRRCRDERRSGMLVECRAFRSRCDWSSRFDAATVVARRARHRRLMLGAVGVVLAGLLLPVARSPLGGLRATVGAVTLPFGAPTGRPAASGKDEQRDQEPGGSPSPAGAEGRHEL